MKSLNNFEKKISLSTAQKILLTTDGSITRILEAISGEPVTIKTIIQDTIKSNLKISYKLKIEVGSEVNYRVVNLKNRKKVLIRAISYAPNDRLPQKFREDIRKKDSPIGRIMEKLNIEARREIKGFELIKSDTDLSKVFKIPLESNLLKREYNIIFQEKVLLNITEIFPHELFRN